MSFEKLSKEIEDGQKRSMKESYGDLKNNSM